jgi:hypothetical protein
MKKVPSLFQRNYDGDRLVRDEVVAGSEWVLAGEGVATRKWDGTATMVRGGQLFKRYDAKPGRKPPSGWESCEEAPDQHTGHWPGWVPVGPGPEDKWLRALATEATGLPDGTYEAIGPHFQGNQECCDFDRLVRHGEEIVDCPRDFVSIREFLRSAGIEGVVWHHPDGRMTKIKAKDFGVKRAMAAKR